MTQLEFDLGEGFERPPKRSGRHYVCDICGLESRAVDRGFVMPKDWVIHNNVWYCDRCWKARI